MLSIFAAVLIVGGIAFGIFTATEASAVAVVYSMFLGFVVYRELKWKDMGVIFMESVKTTAVVMFLIGCASAFAWMMTFLQVPGKVMEMFLGITDNPFLLLLLVNILLLFLGTIMDLAPLILIATPILLPVVQTAGMSPITFGVVLLLNLGIGLTTPPVGSGLFVGCTVGKTTMEKCTKSMLMLWPIMFLVLILTTYIPWFTTFLPSVFGPK